MTRHRFALCLALAGMCLGGPVTAQTAIYTQPPSGAGTIIPSAIVPPDGVDGNAMIWDSFTLGTNQTITDIHWRGGYTNFLSGAGESPVLDFVIAIWPTVAGQPDVIAGPLVQYNPTGNCGETLAGTFGGIPMYDYQYTLPSPFPTTAGTRYWLQIYAHQMPTPFYGWPPDWGFSIATGGDGSHFRATLGGTGGGGTLYQSVTADVAFTLYASSGPSYAIAASENPPGSGAIAGTGAYPSGALATLQALANPGYGFVNWTENGTPVSTSATYAFTVAGDRTLVANFATAYTITTTLSPIYGGTVSGGGTYVSGSPVSAVATPDPGWVFVNWTEFGTPVSSLATYDFTADADHALVANFTPTTASAMFDFDTGTPPLGTGSGLPFTQVANGVTAFFSSPQGTVFSVQSDASTQWHMGLFSGNYLYDNDLNRNTLDITFDHPLNAIYLTFATADFNQQEQPTNLQLTGYLNSTANPAVGLVSTRGAYIGSTMPMGTLSFHPGTPFNIVELVLPYQALGCTDFFVDDVMVALAPTNEAPPGTASASFDLAPNPARQAMDIRFALRARGAARVTVFDVHGRRVRGWVMSDLTPGPHVVRWDTRGDDRAPVRSGAYFVRIETPERSVTRRAVVLR
ncbi:MAG TPA: T9SS type A sorting domain-containing protein [Candidatus Eisenbacteria bacterium]|nr:T9SS type A sorting domain-containing protein [Candidatus Eisenbacteria bacterium]